MGSDNRPAAALLTRAQRDLLETPEDERKGKNKQKLRRRLRKRLRRGLGDFYRLFRGLSERDRDMLLGIGENDVETQSRLYDGLVANLALLYEFADRLGWDFEYLLKDAVNEVYSSTSRTPRGRAVDDVTVEVSTSEISTQPSQRARQHAIDKFERGEVLSLTDRELRILIECGDLDAKVIVERYRKAAREQRARASDMNMVEDMNKKLQMFGDPADDENGES